MILMKYLYVKAHEGRAEFHCQIWLFISNQSVPQVRTVCLTSDLSSWLLG